MQQRCQLDHLIHSEYQTTYSMIAIYYKVYELTTTNWRINYWH